MTPEELLALENDNATLRAMIAAKDRALEAWMDYHRTFYDACDDADQIIMLDEAHRLTRESEEEP